MKDLLITPAKAMVVLCCGAAMLQSRGVVVSTGSVVESGSGVASVEIMATERLGNLAVEFQKDWRFDPLTPAWDPLYPDGGFDVPEIECAGAKPFAVASDRFADRSLDGLPPVAFYHRVGKGVTVLLASIDPPAASGVRRLYSRILDQAVTATDVWPKVECSDRVRYSVYPDGTIYVLNTENSLRSEVIVRRSENTPPERILLASGELKHLPFCVKENQ